MVIGGLKAIPSMVKGTAQAALEFGRWGAGLGPSEEAAAEMQRHIAAATAPGADLTTRAAEGFQAIPMVGPMVAGVVRGGQEIAAPLAKTIVSGVGTVTPEEMNTAADTGGAAIAGLAAPELVRGVPAVAGKMPGVGKLLKFAPPAVVAISGHPVLAAKMLVKGALTEAVLKPLGTIVTDQVLARIAARDVEGASAALARGLERSPEASKAFATAMEQEANKVAPAGLPPMSDTTPNAIAARTADRVARQRAALARGSSQAPIVAPEPVNAPTWSPLAEEAAGVQAPVDPRTTGYPRGAPVNVGPWETVDPLPEPARTPQMPVLGNVKLQTVYTKPGPKVKPPAGESAAAKALAEKQAKLASPDAIRAAFGEPPKGTPHGKKGPSGAPLTAAERREALIKLQQSIASGDDIFAAFGLEN